MFQSGTGPVTRHPSSKLSSHPINQTNEQSVCEKTSAGDTLHLGLSKLFSCFSTTHSLSFWSFLSPGGITHFEKENISYRLALRKPFVFFSPPPVGRTLFNSPLIMFLFCPWVQNHFCVRLKAEDGFLGREHKSKICYLSFQMVAIMDVLYI